LDRPGFAVYSIKQSRHRTLTIGRNDVTGDSQEQMAITLYKKTRLPFREPG